MKPGEIRQLTKEELLLKLRNTEEDLFKARLQKHIGQLSNTAQLGLLKKEVARVKTELKARAMAPEAKES